MNNITIMNQAVIKREILIAIITILTIHILQYSNYILQRILCKPEALLKIQWDKCIVTSQLSKKCNIRMRVIVEINDRVFGDTNNN